MKTIMRLAIALGLAGMFMLLSSRPTQNDMVVAQGRKPVYMYRLYTGPDGRSHIQKVEAKFAENEISKMMAITGAELHRSKPGRSHDFHVGPQRQYIVNLSGSVELEVAGGEKVDLSPGDIEVIEDTTGQGHITRTLGNEDRVSLWLAFVDQSGK
jgi:hypothetical protein